MFYLSQLLGKPVYFENKPYGKIIDMAIFHNRPHPPISKIEIKHGKKKLTVSPQAITFKDNHFVLNSQQVPLLPYDHKDFYLAEDLLDKQVIDTDGKRLVRVNDVVLDINGEIKVAGIDIGFSGIIRRLGLGNFSGTSKVIPWQFIEAFDYQTGTIQIKLTQSKLNSLHPSELADILEDVGAKERLGIVAALDAKKAAQAIEETDTETQISILEELPVSGSFKDVLNKMHISEIADIFHYLKPIRTEEIQNALGKQKTQDVKRLLAFSDDVAGGLMRTTFFAIDGDNTVKQAIKHMGDFQYPPETIIVTNGGNKLVGTITTKNLLITDQLALLKDITRDKKYVFASVHLSDIFKLFTEYNLRALPVVDTERKPIGIIVIDDLLRIIEQEQEEDENL